MCVDTPISRTVNTNTSAPVHHLPPTANTVNWRNTVPHRQFLCRLPAFNRICHEADTADAAAAAGAARLITSYSISRSGVDGIFVGYLDRTKRGGRHFDGAITAITQRSDNISSGGPSYWTAGVRLWLMERRLRSWLRFKRGLCIVGRCTSVWQCSVLQWRLLFPVENCEVLFINVYSKGHDCR